MKKTLFVVFALTCALVFSADAAGGRGGGGRGGGSRGGGGAPGGGGRGGPGGQGGGPSGPSAPGNARVTGGTNAAVSRVSRTTPGVVSTNAVATSTNRYQFNADLTKIGTNSISFKVYTNRPDSSLRISQSTKVLVETDEMEDVPGKQGQKRPKTTAGKQSDLDVGQRIKVAHNGSVISEITILKRQGTKVKEQEKTETTEEN